MSSFFQDQEQEPVIPTMLQEVDVPTATPEDVDDATRQATFAARAMNVDDVDSYKEQAKDVATFSGKVGVREMVSRTDLQMRQQKNVGYIAEIAATAAPEVLANQMVTLSLLDQEKYALEDNAVKSIKDTLPDRIKGMVDASVIEDIAKDEAFKLKLRNKFATIQNLEDNESLFSETVDFIKAITFVEALEPLVFGSGGVGGVIDDLRGVAFAAKQLPLEEQEAFYGKHAQELLSKAQFLKDNPQFALDMMGAAMDGTEKQREDLKFWQGVGIIFAPFEVAAAGKSLLNVAKSVGNNRSIADDILKGSEDDWELITSEDDVISSTIPYKVPTDLSDGVYSDVQESLELNRRRLQDTSDNFTSQEFFATTEARRVEEFKASHGANRVLNSSVDLSEDGDVVFTVGTTRGTGFKSETAAQKFLTNSDLKGEVIKHPSGGFAVKTRTQLLPGISGAIPTDLSTLNKMYGNVDNIVSGLATSGGRVAGDAELSMYAASADVFKNSLKGFTGKKTVALWSIVQKGVDEDVWLTQKGLVGAFNSRVGRAPTSQEVEAYYAYKQLNDFDWEIKNKALHREAEALGHKEYTVSVGGDIKFNAAEVDHNTIIVNKTNSEDVHIFEDGKASSTAKEGGLDEKTLKELSKTHNLVNLGSRFRASLFEEGISDEVVRYAYVPKKSKGKKLGQAQMPHKAGGRRVNNYPAYLKAARVKRTKSGKVIRMPDVAMFGAISMKTAKKVSDHFGELLTKLKETPFEKLSDLDDLVAKMDLGAVGMHTAKEAHAIFKSHGLFKYDDIHFGAVRDRKQVDVESKLSGEDLRRFRDDSDEPMMASVRNQMNGMRGDRLKNLDGEKSLILDPMGALSDSLNTAAKFASISGYRDNMLKLMSDKFRRYLSIDPHANPIELLKAAPLKHLDDKPGLRRSIEAHQQYLTDIISQRTKWEEEYVQKAQSFLDMVFDKASFWRTKLDSGWMEKGSLRKGALDAAAVDPAGRVKNLVFNAKLGAFNPASFIMQAINITNIVALSPRYGMGAAKNALPAKLALAGGVDDKMLHIIAKGWKAGGFSSKEDFLDYMSEFKHLGLGNIGKGIAEIGAYNGAQLGSSAMSTVADWSRSAFNAGELLSRLTAYGAARGRWLGDAKLNPKKLSPNSPEGRAWIGNETHRLSLGMSAQDVQLGFRGLVGVPTQFWSYPFRLIGSMFGKSFTKAEKTQLLLMQGLLYGSAGIPVVDTLVNMYTAKSQDLESTTAAKALTNGAIDAMIYHLSEGEVNTNFAGRAGVGQFVTDFVRMFTDKTAAEVATGASGQMMSGLLGTVYRSIEGYGIMNDPTLDNVGRASLEILKSEITSLKSLEKLDLALRFGYIFDKNGKRYAGIDDIGAWLMVGGLPPQAYENTTLSYIAKEDRRTKVNTFVGMAVKFHREASEAYAKGDLDRVNEINQSLHGVSMLAHEYGLHGDYINGVRNAQTQDDSLKRLIYNMSKFDAQSTGATARGVNQAVLRQELNRGEE